MNTKVLIGGVIGGVVSFLLGWLIYGILLKDFMENNCSSAGQRPMDDMIMWAMFLSCLVGGYFLAMIFGWTSTSGWSMGAQKGAVLGLLIALMIDLNMYAMTTTFNSFTPIIVDVAATVVMYTGIGAAIGWYNSRGTSNA